MGALIDHRRVRLRLGGDRIDAGDLPRDRLDIRFLEVRGPRPAASAAGPREVIDRAYAWSGRRA